MRRVSVVGTPGAGKSTVGAALAERLGVPWVELDSLYHLPDWGKPDEDDFRRLVAGRLDADGWVVDGNYHVVHDLLRPRVDTVVWLDLERRVIMGRLVRRTAGRVVRRTELWAGNRERLRDMLSFDAERSILLWAWTRFPLYRRRYADAMADPAWSSARFVRLRTPAEVERFLETAGGTVPDFPDARWGSDHGLWAAVGRRFVGTTAGSALVRRLVPWDRTLLRRSNGRYTALGPFGVPLLLLTTTGARSGQPRTTPLVFLRRGPALLLAGSNFGQSHHPAWSTNLLAHPEAQVNIGGERVAVRSRLLDGAERQAAWELFRAAGPYGVYETRTDRTIRVFALDRIDPVGHPDDGSVPGPPTPGGTT
jgi:deazaflavin-dependent oxidoreductase (nitroreductase family)